MDNFDSECMEEALKLYVLHKFDKSKIEIKKPYQKDNFKDNFDSVTYEYIVSVKNDLIRVEKLIKYASKYNLSELYMVLLGLLYCEILRINQ